MVEMKDAATALVGRILAVEFTRDFDTKKADGGAKVFIHAGDGFSNVTLDAEAVQYEEPAEGKSIAWFVRMRPWKMEGGRSGMANSYVRPITEDDLDQINSAISASTRS